MTTKHLTADVVTAKSFVLVDDKNRERGILSSAGGAVVFHLSDHVGRPRITLQVDRDGNPGICLFTEDNAPAVSIGIHRDRGNGMFIGDADGVPCVEIGIPNAGSDHPLGESPFVVVRDHDGQQLWSTTAK